MSKASPIAARPAGPGRPPIVAIVGHIDHGKSTLLDYIRKSNIAAGEAGGITQHLSAYEAVHQNASGAHKLTFLDTPGHEAFKAMRARGLEVADVAVLIVSSEEGAKPQTIEALKLIEEANIPYIVAFTKIDKPGSNIEKAKLSMLEHQIFLEGMGGEVPWVGISSKSGEGVPELLDLILLAAELHGLSYNPSTSAEGVVIEAHKDSLRGNTATLIIRDGTLRGGAFVVAGAAWAPVRIMENFLGKAVKEAGPGSPVRIVGFSQLPQIGARFTVVAGKKEAEAQAGAALIPQHRSPTPTQTAAARSEDASAAAAAEPETLILPIVIKTDVAGVGEAVMHEIDKLPQDPRLDARVVARGVGAITEGDVKLVGSARAGVRGGIILGFNVKVEREARDLAERLSVEIATFDIIYKLTEWLRDVLEQRRPKHERAVLAGAAKVLKFFSSQKGRVILGGRVEEGALKQHQEVKILRRDLELGQGSIVGLQSNKKDVKAVEAGAEFGALIKTSVIPAAGDRLEAYTTELS